MLQDSTEIDKPSDTVVETQDRTQKDSNRHVTTTEVNSAIDGNSSKNLKDSISDIAGFNVAQSTSENRAQASIPDQGVKIEVKHTAQNVKPVVILDIPDSAQIFKLQPMLYKAPSFFPEYPLYKPITFQSQDTDTLSDLPNEQVKENLRSEDIELEILVDVTSEQNAEKTHQDRYIPNWKDTVRLKELSAANPSEYAVSVVKTEPEQYKLKLELTNTDWVFWTIMFSLCAIAWIKIFFGKALSNTLEATVNGQIASRMLRERNSLSVKISIGLNLIFALNTGIFAYQVAAVFDAISPNIKGYWIAGSAFIVVIILYALKEALLKTLGYVADISAPIYEYLNIVSINNKSLGVILYGIIISVQYAHADVMPKETIVYVGFSVYAIAYISRIIRGLIISLRSNLSVFYAILYLCALEIAPNMLLYLIATSLF